MLTCLGPRGSPCSLFSSCALCELPARVWPCALHQVAGQGNIEETNPPEKHESATADSCREELESCGPPLASRLPGPQTEENRPKAWTEGRAPAGRGLGPLSCFGAFDHSLAYLASPSCWDVIAPRLFSRISSRATHISCKHVALAEHESYSMRAAVD
ncbi:hypothetical protein V2G26_008007 [Clonostachys chloroleuca]